MTRGDPERDPGDLPVEAQKEFYGDSSEDEEDADDRLEPGFYRARKGENPPAYFQVTEERKAVVVYPSGEVARNDAAILLLQNDILPVADVGEVPKDETPFADDVQPRPMEGGPDPVQPVE